MTPKQTLITRNLNPHPYCMYERGIHLVPPMSICSGEQLL
jgi:hypothetical protein